jgi:DNA-binding transcriptional regulator YhcF (GntR family)
MNLEIDFRSGIPIYLQVVERIKDRLAGGQLKPGDQLPAVAENMRQKALEELTRRYLADARRLSASPDELIKFLKEQINSQ